MTLVWFAAVLVSQLQRCAAAGDAHTHSPYSYTALHGRDGTVCLVKRRVLTHRETRVKENKIKIGLSVKISLFVGLAAVSA